MMGRFESLSISIKSFRFGLIAIPRSVTKISTVEPGVVKAVTDSLMMGVLDLIKFDVIMDTLAPKAVSE